MTVGRTNSMNPSKVVLVFAVVLALAAGAGCSSLQEHMYLKEGVKFYKGQKYLDAAKEFEKALTYNPSRAETLKNIGYCYWSMIEPGSTAQEDVEYTNKALEAFRQYLETNPEDSEKIQDYLINLYINQGRLEDGIQFYEALLKESPSDSRIIRTLALMYGKRGDFAKSLEFSVKLAALTPDDAAGYVFIGALTWQRSYNKQDPTEVRAEIVEKGMTALQKALTLKPDSFEALLYTNLLYRQKAELSKLASEFERDRKRAKELQDEAAAFVKLADEFKDKAVAARKAQQEKEAAEKAGEAAPEKE